jgi:hypothetical protein
MRSTDTTLLYWQQGAGATPAVPRTIGGGGLAVSSRETTRSAAPETDAADAIDNDVSTISASNLSLHDLFAQQARHMLERADLDEEQKQTILVAMSCPCCGAGGMSFSVKLKD